MIDTLTRPAASPSVRKSAFSSRSGQASSTWFEAFVWLLVITQVAQAFLTQVAPFVGGLGPARMLVRSTPYGASLALLMILASSPRRARHPATGLAGVAMVILAVSILHPTTNTLLAGFAHAALYLAIFAPLFWVPRLRIDLSIFRRVVIILWSFHTLSAGLGVLQVYFPDRLQPDVSELAGDADYVEAQVITTASGQSVFRPVGLTDRPGGAATGGFYAVLFGVGLLLTDRRTWLKAVSLVSITVGLMVIYLSQIRSIMVLTAVSVLVCAAMLVWRRDLAKAGMLSAVLSVLALGSFMLAVSVGGASVADRLGTLVAERPSEVYASNRGVFLEQTIEELLPRYPGGAGLGRHGMMNANFGDNSRPERSAIWVEIQWTAWLVDGGVPLILAYASALLAALWAVWSIALQRTSSDPDAEVPFWGVLLVAFNIGGFALTFSYPLFMGQSGMEFWLLNAALFTAAHGAARKPASSRALHQ
jgi:hypothetical protein